MSARDDHDARERRSSAGTSTSRSTSAHGDEFSVLYEQKYQDGQYVSDGRVLAAEFVNQGKTHRAVWFESPDGQVHGYFTPDGKGMRKAFLRAPLDFTRISSVFNPRRKHPICGMHPRAQGHRLRRADRHADLGGGRRPRRVRGPQGRLRQRRDHRSRQGHHRPCTATCRASASRCAPAARVAAGRDHRLRRHDRRSPPARTCTTNTGSTACTRTRRRSRCRARRSRRDTWRSSRRPVGELNLRARAGQRTGSRSRASRAAEPGAVSGRGGRESAPLPQPEARGLQVFGFLLEVGGRERVLVEPALAGTRARRAACARRSMSGNARGPRPRCSSTARRSSTIRNSAFTCQGGISSSHGSRSSLRRCAPTSTASSCCSSRGKPGMSACCSR